MDKSVSWMVPTNMDPTNWCFANLPFPKVGPFSASGGEGACFGLSFPKFDASPVGSRCTQPSWPDNRLSPHIPKLHRLQSSNAPLIFAGFCSPIINTRFKNKLNEPKKCVPVLLPLHILWKQAGLFQQNKTLKTELWVIITFSFPENPEFKGCRFGCPAWYPCN